MPDLRGRRVSHFRLPALMRLDAPGDGVIRNFDVGVRSLEPIVCLGLGGGLVERGNRVPLQLDTALLVVDGIGLFQRWGFPCTRPPYMSPDSCASALYPAAATAALAGCTIAVKSSINFRVML